MADITNDYTFSINYIQKLSDGTLSPNLKIIGGYAGDADKVNFFDAPKEVIESSIKEEEARRLEVDESQIDLNNYIIKDFSIYH